MIVDSGLLHVHLLLLLPHLHLVFLRAPPLMPLTCRSRRPQRFTAAATTALHRMPPVAGLLKFPIRVIDQIIRARPIALVLVVQFGGGRAGLGMGRYL